MPDYVGNYEIVASTRNFLITCEDDGPARQRAQAVAATCEYDLKRLNDLFGTNFEAGNTSEFGIWVVVFKASAAAGSGGSNYGYETDESSRIFMTGNFTAPSPPPPPPPGPALPPSSPPPNYAWAVVEYPRLVFVAELAEILMDFTGYGWGRGNSMGEGLSIVLATLLHPDGYYATGSGPRINDWLNGVGGPQRMDRVASTEDTDRNQFSYGCAILFINYLVSQLGFSMKQVIKAGGGNLAQTFARLTGKPESAAYAEFNALLQKHLGNSTTNNLQRDNIFPLYDPDHRHVSVNVGDPITWDDTADAQTFFDIKPGLICPVGNYGFTRHRQQQGMAVYAHATGTAAAACRWTIAGLNTSVQAAWQNLTIPVPTQVRNPDRTVSTISASTNIQYRIVNTWNGSVLYLQYLDKAGNCSFEVKAFAHEASANDADVSAAEPVGLDGVWWEAGEEMKKAWQRCNPFFANVDKSLWGLSKVLGDLKNRPDPPSDRSILKVVESVQELSKAVAQYARAGNLSEAEVWKQVGTPGALRSGFAPPDDADLRRGPVQQPKKNREAD